MESRRNPATREPRSLPRVAALVGASGALNRVGGIAVSIVIARFLLPAEVGVLGLASMLMLTMSIGSASVETAAMVSRGHASDRDYASACLALRSAVAFLALLLFLGLGPSLAGFFLREPASRAALPGVLLVMWLTLAAEAVSSFPRILLQRRSRFRPVFLASSGQIALYSVACIAVLLLGGGVLEVSMAQAAAAWMATLGLLREANEVAEIPPSTAAMRLVALGSLKTVVADLGGFLSAKVDNLVVLRLLGESAMSFYSLAFSLSRLPVDLLSHTVMNTLIVSSQSQTSDEVAANRIRGATALSSLVAVPVCLVLWIGAPEWIALVLGVKWLAATPILRVLVLSGLINTLTIPCSAVLTAAGSAHRVGFAILAQIMLILAGVGLGGWRFGTVGAAWGEVAAQVGLAAFLLGLVRSRFGVDLRALATHVAPPYLAGCLSLLAAVAAASALGPGLGVAMATSVLSVATYVMALRFCGGAALLAQLISTARRVRGA